ESFDARLWIAGDPDTKNRLIFSGVGDAGIFPPENNFWIGGDDGDWITGMATFYSREGGYRSTPLEQLLVGKNSSIIKVVPTNEVDYYMTTRLSSGVGFASNSAIASAEGMGLLFPDQTGVYIYDGRQVRNISLKVKPIFDGWNLGQLEDCSGVYNPKDRHYYLSYPDTGSTKNNKTIAFNVNFGAPLPQSFVASAYAYQHGISDTVKVVFADTGTSDIYWYGVQADDIDDPVIMTYQTPYMDFGVHPYYDTWTRFGAVVADLDTGWIFFDWYKDYGTLAYSDSFQCGNACRKQRDVVESVIGRNVSLKITTGSTIDNIELDAVFLKYRIQTERR
ncbi:unnamed protein product, partial [marine sediment metagenome]